MAVYNHPIVLFLIAAGGACYEYQTDAKESFAGIPF